MTYTQIEQIKQMKMDRFNSWYNIKLKKVTNYDENTATQICPQCGPSLQNNTNVWTENQSKISQNNKLNKEQSIFGVSGDNIENEFQIVDDYINFKKKSYKYNYYNNFNKKYKYNYSNIYRDLKYKEFNFQKGISDNNNWRNPQTTTTEIQNDSVNIELSSENTDVKEVDTISLKKIQKKNNVIIESKNYPEIDHLININDIKKLDDCTLNSKLKSLNIEINMPIISYGIVLYTYEKNKYLKYLICQRRDSISYIQYLQDLIDEKNIVKYINLMSKEEKKRCLEYYYKRDAHSIWKDLWINHKSKIYKNHYERCTNMFLKNMEKYLEHFKNENIGQIENSWCFPKGRLNKNENEIECAMRELEEETNISSNIVNVNKNISFEEL